MLINMPTLIIYIVPQLSLDKEPGYEGKQNVAYHMTGQVYSGVKEGESQAFIPKG